jgi:hypothetical protein
MQIIVPQQGEPVCWSRRTGASVVVPYITTLSSVLMRRAAVRDRQTYATHEETNLHVISGFFRDIDEICAFLGYYATSSGNPLPTFRDNV